MGRIRGCIVDGPAHLLLEYQDAADVLEELDEVYLISEARPSLPEQPLLPVEPEYSQETVYAFFTSTRFGEAIAAFLAAQARVFVS